MTKKIIFQDSFLISGIMCHAGCGFLIQDCLDDCLIECKKELLLPNDAQLHLDAEPQALGIHRLLITVESNKKHPNHATNLSNKFKICINSIEPKKLQIIDNIEPIDKPNHVNWINISINALAIAAITMLSVMFPPSWPLTVGLTALSFLTTAFTARGYLMVFFRNLRTKNPVDMMTTSITLGWLLSLVHTLYHSITMPFMINFSMTFMNFIMPVMLIMVINGMDEIKQLILSASRTMHLRGIKTLFPQMAEEYLCHDITQQEQDTLSQSEIPDILKRNSLSLTRKNLLKKGMIIQINPGTCFPVDCILIHGNTCVDASLITGEHQQHKQCLDFIPAGAINLGNTVTVRAEHDAYNSTVNKLLFRSNRADKPKAQDTNNTFIYLYTGLIATGLITSIGLPFALGTLSVSLALQNITGILFAVCPCTIAIAHQLPNLLSLYQRAKKGIVLRNEQLCGHFDEIHTVVFDKTGTLTTGNSTVVSSEGISDALWQRIYLLEKNHGAAHPLAKAIEHYCKGKFSDPLLNDINHVQHDSKNRGLSAVVQGRQIHIGNADYLIEAGIAGALPLNTQGFTPVYIAEDNVYKGVIYIQHDARPGILAALRRLKEDKKVKIIMLTGDTLQAAIRFNQENGSIFNLKDIHAKQSPQDKENFLSKLMGAGDKGVWFVGDGLNDAPCAKIVTEKGGISCAMASDNKTVFFTDISLNGTLDYLFEHHNMNQFSTKNIFQNQCLLAYGSLVFLAFVTAFSITGIAVSPLIPLLIMASTTLFILFNSYRVQLSIDNAMDKKKVWAKQLIASDLSIGLLAGSSALFMMALLISTVTTGALALPVIAGISGVCVVGASGLLGLFVLLSTAYLFVDVQVEEPFDLVADTPIKSKQPSLSLDFEQNRVQKVACHSAQISLEPRDLHASAHPLTHPFYGSYP